MKSIQTPQSKAAARHGSVSGSLRRATRIPTSAISAGGKNQAASRPNSPLRKRPGPLPSATVGRPAGRRLRRVDRGDRGRRRRAAGLIERVAREPVGSVVREDLADDRVVAAAVDVGAVVDGDEGDEADVTEGDGHDDETGQEDVSGAADQAGDGRGDEVGPEEGGDDDPGLEHLGLEGQADPDAGQEQCAQAPAQEGAGGGVGGQDEQQDEQGIGDVAPIQKDRDRGGGHDERGDQPGDGARRPGARPGRARAR